MAATSARARPHAGRDAEALRNRAPLADPSWQAPADEPK
jgi:hypothetical protein